MKLYLRDALAMLSEGHNCLRAAWKEHLRNLRETHQLPHEVVSSSFAEIMQPALEAEYVGVSNG